MNDWSKVVTMGLFTRLNYSRHTLGWDLPSIQTR